MPGVINTGSHPKLLWPGIHAIWGQVYNEHATEYTDLYDQMCFPGRCQSIWYQPEMDNKPVHLLFNEEAIDLPCDRWLTESDPFVPGHCCRVG